MLAIEGHLPDEPYGEAQSQRNGCVRCHLLVRGTAVCAVRSPASSVTDSYGKIRTTPQFNCVYDLKLCRLSYRRRHLIFHAASTHHSSDLHTSTCGSCREKGIWWKIADACYGGMRVQFSVTVTATCPKYPR